MPYHRRRRQGCKVVPAHQSPSRIGMAVRASSRSPPGLLIRGQAWGRPFRTCSGMAACASGRIAARGAHFGVEYTIRPARITDIDRLAAIGRSAMTASGRGSLDAADLLRQCVYLPHASVLVAEARRELVGGALLVAPSVGDRRRLRGDDRLPGRRPGPRCGSRDGIAPGGAAPLGEQQGLLRGRSGSALRPRGPRPPRARRVRPCRSQPPAPRPGGGSRSQPHLAPRPWAGGPGSNRHRSH